MTFAPMRGRGHPVALGDEVMIVGPDSGSRIAETGRADRDDEDVAGLSPVAAPSDVGAQPLHTAGDRGRSRARMPGPEGATEVCRRVHDAIVEHLREYEEREIAEVAVTVARIG